MPNRNELPREEGPDKNAPEVFDATEKGDYDLQENNEGVFEFVKKEEKTFDVSNLSPDQLNVRKNIENMFFSDNRESDISNIIEYVRKAKETFNMPEEIILNTVKRAVDWYVKTGRIDRAVQICHGFNVPRQSAISDDVAKEAIRWRLEDRDFTAL